jgi:para-nitrobenzyl esterase
MQKTIISFIAVFSVCLSTLAQIQTGENIAVTNTESGKVRGYVHNTIYTYKGIPYAEAKRFMAPEKPKS